jgi:hypothetical protein
MFSFSSISRDYISLQAPCQIVVNRPAWLGRPISLAPAFDIQIHFIYLMCHTALLLLIFMSFRVLNSILRDGRSKRVMKFDGFDHSKFWEGKDVDISTSLKKTKIMFSGTYSKHHVVYIPNINVFVFFYIQGLYIFASTLSNFGSSLRAGRMVNFSLP